MRYECCVIYGCKECFTVMSMTFLLIYMIYKGLGIDVKMCAWLTGSSHGVCYLSVLLCSSWWGRITL